MSELSLEASGIAKTAERQMRQWVVNQQVQQALVDEESARRLSQTHPYVAISRQAGVGSGQIARQLGERLGWNVFDKELLDSISQQYHVPHVMLEYADETTNSWLWDVLGKWLNPQIVSHSEYVAHLRQVVVMAARHASTVFVGRGVQFLLPRQCGLAIRIVAPLEQRILHVMEQQGCSRRAAFGHVQRCDRGRRDFVRDNFHHDPEDSSLYDLVIDRGEMDVEAVVECLLRRCHERFPAINKNRHPVG